ncbi:glycosyltransferase family 2 protein [Aeromonas encheleia]
MKNIIKEIQESGLFDADWYLKQYPDVRKNKITALEHYLSYGWRLGRNPSADFDTNYYLKSNSNNSDIKISGINPLLHYIRNGQIEGRNSKATRVLSDNAQIKLEVFTLNKDYAAKIKKNELGYLLEYAALLRKSGCLESYVGIVKYLALNYDHFIERLQKILLNHIRNVILLTSDQELIDYFSSERLHLLLAMDLPKSKIKEIINLPNLSISYREINKNCIFDLQNEDEIIDILIQNPNALSNNKELGILFSNAYAREQNVSFYNKTVETYLNQEGCETTFSLRYFSDNILSNVATKATNSEWTDYGLITVIMSAYNSESTVAYAINSLLNQTYKNIEILVCDDNSTDQTLSIIRNISNKDSRVKVFSSQNNQGTYNIRNHMIKRAKGKYITFQDSDDYALPARLQRQVTELNEKNATLCFTRWIRVTPDGQFVFFVDGILKRFCVVSAMIRSDYLNNIAEFRQSLVAADTEFYEYCKNSLQPNQIVHVETPLILGLWGNGSLTKMANLNAEHTGYVAPRRLAYSEISGKQRLLDNKVITDNLIDDKLKELNIYMNKSRVQEY